MRETTSKRGFIGIFNLHYEQVSSLYECFPLLNSVSQLHRTVCITEYNYKSSNLQEKSTDSEIITRLDDNNSDTGGKKTVVPWLASYEICKPEVNKTVSNTQLKHRNRNFYNRYKGMSLRN